MKRQNDSDVVQSFRAYNNDVHLDKSKLFPVLAAAVPADNIRSGVFGTHTLTLM